MLQKNLKIYLDFLNRDNKYNVIPTVIPCQCFNCFYINVNGKNNKLSFASDHYYDFI